MINLTREETQQVLEGLDDYWVTTDEGKELVETLRAKLSEPEPEPVAYRAMVDGMWFTAEKKEKLKHELNKAHINADIEPLYTAPPQRKECQRCGEVNPAEIHTCTPQREWVGLTEEEYEAMAEQYVTNCYFDTLKYAKAIEAKLKDKNAC